MNEKFRKKVQSSGKSLYAISHESGVAYTTLNELYNGKTDINKCSAETVYILATYFKCDCYDILNDFIFPKNIKGNYMGVKYVWRESEQSTIEFCITDNGKEVVVYGNSGYKFPDNYSHYKMVSEALVEYYLEEKEKEALLNDYLYSHAQK